MVRLVGWTEENCREGFSRSDSRMSSKDSTTSMRTGPWAGRAGECFPLLGDCAETANAATKDSRDARRKLILANSGSGFTCFLVIEDSLAREEFGPNWDSAGPRIVLALFASSQPHPP